MTGRTLVSMFIFEAERLGAEGKIPEAICSLRNALSCRDCLFSTQVTLRTIISDLTKLHLGRKA